MKKQTVLTQLEVMSVHVQKAILEMGFCVKVWINNFFLIVDAFVVNFRY